MTWTDFQSSGYYNMTSVLSLVMAFSVIITPLHHQRSMPSLKAEPDHSFAEQHRIMWKNAMPKVGLETLVAVFERPVYLCSGY